MQQQSSKSSRTSRRSAGVAGVKALIAVASVAATVAGWAILPANDPPAAAGAAAAQTSQQTPSLSVPGGSSSLQVPNDPFQMPNTGQSLPSSHDNSQLPQVQAPQGFSRFPFTRTHSSR